MSIGDRIRVARERAGLSQAQLAEAIRVAQPTVANWENGNHDPQRPKVALLAAELRVDQEWLEFGRGRGPGGVADEPRPPAPPEIDDKTRALYEAIGVLIRAERFGQAATAAGQLQEALAAIHVARQEAPV
ncbi:MAG: helix-turn-helix transcriptional regulator [Alphaproteobacteria bacterium]